MPNPLPPGIRPAFPRRIPTFGIRTRFLELLGLDRMPDAVDATVEAAAAAGAAVCGVPGSLSRLIHEGNTWRHSSLIFVPHLLRCFDHGVIVGGCIPPARSWRSPPSRTPTCREPGSTISRTRS